MNILCQDSWLLTATSRIQIWSDNSDIWYCNFYTISQNQFIIKKVHSIKYCDILGLDGISIVM
jgi:hypothetical protein